MYRDPVTPTAVTGFGHRIATRIDLRKVVDGFSQRLFAKHFASCSERRKQRRGSQA